MPCRVSPYPIAACQSSTRLPRSDTPRHVPPPRRPAWPCRACLAVTRIAKPCRPREDRPGRAVPAMPGAAPPSRQQAASRFAPPCLPRQFPPSPQQDANRMSPTIGRLVLSSLLQQAMQQAMTCPRQSRPRFFLPLLTPQLACLAKSSLTRCRSASFTAPCLPRQAKPQPLRPRQTTTLACLGCHDRPRHVRPILTGSRQANHACDTRPHHVRSVTASNTPCQSTPASLRHDP